VHSASLHQNPQSIAVDSQGRIYVAALGSNNVFRVILP
jgi:DNA-binding beta-propeller fold protein YncE